MLHLLLQSQTYLAPPEPSLNENGTDSNNTLTLNNSKWSFFLMWMSCKESLSTVSHILWWLSNNRHLAGGRGLEENSSDISVKHTVRAAVSSLPLEPAVHSEPGWASCPIISLLTWRSRYKRTNNMRINYNHIFFSAQHDILCPVRWSSCYRHSQSHLMESHRYTFKFSQRLWWVMVSTRLTWTRLFMVFLWICSTCYQVQVFNTTSAEFISEPRQCKIMTWVIADTWLVKTVIAVTPSLCLTNIWQPVIELQFIRNTHHAC